ncbi:MAG: nucleoside recognition domain-containing protein [Christensenellales bacterium]
MIFGLLLLLAIVFGFINGTAGEVGLAAMDGAAQGVTICLTLLGGFALWMGVIRVAEKAGIMKGLMKWMNPLIRKLFPGANPEAQQAITGNLAANMLGMGNAATPMGLEAMRHLNRDNPTPGRATNDMVMMLVLNASCIQLLPTSLLALRAQAMAANPADIVLPSIMASAISTVVGLSGAFLLSKVYRK